MTDNPFEALLSHKMDTKRKKSKEDGGSGGGGGEGGGVVYGDLEKLQNGCMQLLLWFVFYLEFNFVFQLIFTSLTAPKEKMNFQNIMAPPPK